MHIHDKLFVLDSFYLTKSFLYEPLDCNFPIL